MTKTAIPVRAGGRETFADPAGVLACRKTTGGQIEVRIPDLIERGRWFVVLNSRGLPLDEFVTAHLGWTWPDNLDRGGMP